MHDRQERRAVGATMAGLAALGFAATALAFPAQWQAEWPRTEFDRSLVDFGEIIALSGSNLVSVILLRLHDTRPLKVIERLTHVLEDCGEALNRGAIVVVEDSRHRVRMLPVGGTEQGGTL